MAQAGHGSVPRRRPVKRQARSWWWLWLIAIAAVPLAGLGLAAADLHEAMLRAPVPVDFLIGTIENAVNRQSTPLKVKIGNASLHYDGGDQAPGFLLTNIEINWPDGRPLAKVPKASVSLNWVHFLSGSFEPSSITLIGSHFGVAFAAGAGLQLRTETGNPEAAKDSASTVGAAQVGQPGSQPSSRIDATPTVLPAALDPVAILSAIINRPRHTGGSPPATLHIRDALLDIAGSGRSVPWHIPSFDFRLGSQANHDILVGSGDVVAPSGPFHATLTAERPESGELLITTALDHVVPADFADLNPALNPLAPALLPVGGEATMAFSVDGSLTRLDMNVGLGHGQFEVGGACSDSFKLDQGGLHIKYLKGTGRIELLPSDIRSNGSSATVSGVAIVSHDAAGKDRWQYNLQLANASVADPQHGLAAAVIDSWSARGTVTPSSGEAVLDRLAMQAGDLRLAMAGRVSSAGVEFEARVAAASAGLVLRLWPACFQTFARNWAFTNVQSGTISKGHMRVSLDAEGLRRLRLTGKAPDESATAEFEVDDVAFTYAAGLPPVVATHGKMQFTGSQFTADLPEAASQMPSGSVLTITDARYAVANFLDPSPRGKITLKATGPVETALEYLDGIPLGPIKSSRGRFTDLTGEFAGTLNLELPVTRLPQPGDIALKASATLSAVKLAHPIGGFDLQSGTIDLEATETSLRADGDLLVNGVTTKLLWSRAFGPDAAAPPPIRLLATLDANDREQLGILVNHVVSGDVPVILDVAAGVPVEGMPYAHVEANLAQAELVLDTLAWRKPAGDAATLTFDVLAGDAGKTRLDAFRLVGEKVAINGTVELSTDHQLSAFHFPDFSVNVVTRLDVSGWMRPDKVLEVTAHGSYFEGRDFFRSLFSVGQIASRALPPSKATNGLDLTADIDTIRGDSQVALHGVHVHAERRQGNLTALTAKGKLDDGSLIGVRLDHGKGQPRLLRAQAEDAGQAFKLIGLYPGLEGGSASLEVNLDGQGGAEKTGTLWARRFSILGDPVVKQVLTGTQSVGQEIGVPEDRPRFDFDRMRVSFSVGSGQLVLNDMFINGPELGATLRGRIDYTGQTVQLGGTYVPLYGLNSMFGGLPIIGQLLVGRNGEGLLGITFAVQGPLAKPEVVVNPVSAVAPGIFRQIFEIGPEAPRIEPRQGAPAEPVIPRSSSLPAKAGTQANATDIGDPFPAAGADLFDTINQGNPADVPSNSGTKP